jgi:hypothetical protein
MSVSRLPKDRRPNLLGIGAAKAGTTWLASVLAAHPDIFMPPQKELNALHYNDLEARLDEYAAYFRGGETARVRCDFSVRYLASQNAFGAAARHTPDARIVVVLRNPVDQVQSHYWHLRRQNFHQAEPVNPVPDLFEALERFSLLLFEPALYGKHLARWLGAFPRERVLVLTYEEATGAQAATLDRICDFVEVPRRDFSADAAALSAQDGRGGVRPRGGLLDRLYPPLYVAATRYGLNPLKRAFGVRRIEGLKRRLKLRQLGEAVFFTSGYEKLDAAGRLRLWRRFADDVLALEELTGLDVAHWAPSLHRAEVAVAK